MDRVDLGPIVAMQSPRFSYVRIDAQGMLTPLQLAQILSDQRLGHFIAQSGKPAALLNAAGLWRFGTEDLEFVFDRWPPMLASIGVRKLSLVVAEQVHALFGHIFVSSAPRAARAGVELRAFPSAQFTQSWESVTWLDPPVVSAPAISAPAISAPATGPAAYAATMPAPPQSKNLYEMPKLIEQTAWVRAECVGVAFLAPQGGPPGLGLIFKDRDAAAQIFDGWRRDLGARDEGELLRVAIIEGEIPGKPSGYTMTIGPNIDAVVARAAASGGLSFDMSAKGALGSWMRRMNTPPGGSPHLQTFKQMFAQRGEYALVPVVLSGQDIDPRYDKQVVKQTLHLRHASQIGPQDFDAGVLR